MRSAALRAELRRGLSTECDDGAETARLRVGWEADGRAERTGRRNLLMRTLGTPWAVLAGLGFATMALATEPGAPMDCSDLDLAPGLTCTNITEPAADDRTAT